MTITNEGVLTPSSGRFRHLSHHKIILTIPETHKVSAYCVSHMMKLCFTSSSQMKRCPAKRETEEHRWVTNPGSMGMVPTEIFNQVPHLTWHVLFDNGREEPHHRWKDRKVFSLWPTISVAKKKHV